MKKTILYPVILGGLVAMTLGAKPTAPAQIVLPRPPVIHVTDLRADEQSIKVETSESVVAENPFFKRVKTKFTFTNPNTRAMAGELEFPIPEGAVVCGYALEIKGEMVPGVVCEKEKARVAFENEVRKGVDPGIVEQVKGNLWKTRIFPLNYKVPRCAEVDYIMPLSTTETPIKAILERDGEDFFLATRKDAAPQPNIGNSIVNFTQGVILWDASLSTRSLATKWRERLTALPKTGEWHLCFFRNKPSHLVKVTNKTELLAQIDACIYDGGTDLNAAVAALPEKTPVLLFSDEIDTLGLVPTTYETRPGLIIASRNDAQKHDVVIQKITSDTAQATGLKASDGTLLATMWAARRMQDLAAQKDQRKDEFLALGRRYGVAGPGLSLIVLETLEQWIEHKIEPPKTLTCHTEWVRIQERIDGPIAKKKAQAEHEKELLRYWEERVTWWKNPKPPKRTPSSGLFGLAFDRNVATEDEEAEEAEVRTNAAVPPPSAIASQRVHGLRIPSRRARRSVENDDAMDYVDLDAPPLSEDYAPAPKAVSANATPNASVPAIKLKAWDPKMPYIDAIKAAPMGENYAVYLKQRETYADSPAFYLDCASWFFKEHGDAELAERIITNLAEFKLEDAKLWRTMGWRLREAGRYELAERVFRKVLAMRGEEGQSYRDLALILAESAKQAFLTNQLKSNAQLSEAFLLLKRASFEMHARKSGRSTNDLQIAVIALEELNGLISWCEAQPWAENQAPNIPTFDPVYRRDLPVKLRIVMSWDADETDIDLHVLEPNGEEAYYRNRRTAEGGFVSEDVTTGYGPEEYLKKDLESGTYKVLSNYFASHQTSLTGATTVSVTIYTNWGSANETQQIQTLRLDKPKDKHLIGEVTF